jgi:hypothetical protein
MNRLSNKFTGVNAGGPYQLAARMPWAARIAQFLRQAKKK